MHPVKKCSTKVIVITVISEGMVSKVKIIYKRTTEECSMLVVVAIASVLFCLHMAMRLSMVWCLESAMWAQWQLHFVGQCTDNSVSCHMQFLFVPWPVLLLSLL